MPTLFDPLQLGALTLPNRILMAPLTRGRATREGVPTAMMGEYYAQRAAAGLIISEATGISREGLGWPFAPGLWTAAQVEGWKPVIAAVREAGGRIVAQLWHMGRLVHPDFLGGAAPVSASAGTAPFKAHTYEGKKAYGEARALGTDQIERVVDDYVRAARGAMAAGFDGVQIHAANGYLIDQFLRDASNRRDDAYGGPIEHRLRFMSEVASAVAAEVGAERTGIRLSPNAVSYGVEDSDPVALFTAAAAELQRIGIAWIELREPGPQSTFAPSEIPPVSPAMRTVFSGPIVLNSDYDGPSGAARMAEGVADAISFGRPFLANPDLVERIRRGAPLNEWDVATYYSQGAEGYTDYPALLSRP
ncbi:MAG: alkene reductase [Pseudomonadota bacterium]|nr:alkene reductase [Pseudomonadota bacterium]